MKFIVQVLTTVALVAGGAAALDDGIQLSPVFGGPHGKKYSDLEIVSPGQTVKSVTIRAGKRVNGVGIEIVDPSGAPIVLYHGGDGGRSKTITLGAGEYITGIQAHWGEKDGHTRVKFLQFTTSNNNTISGGKPTKDIDADTAPTGFQLGGFFGTFGDELDSVGAIWTSIEPVE